jgi:hypothetical protein
VPGQDDVADRSCGAVPQPNLRLPGGCGAGQTGAARTGVELGHHGVAACHQQAVPASGPVGRPPGQRRIERLAGRIAVRALCCFRDGLLRPQGVGGGVDAPAVGVEGEPVGVSGADGQRRLGLGGVAEPDWGVQLHPTVSADQVVRHAAGGRGGQLGGVTDQPHRATGRGNRVDKAGQVRSRGHAGLVDQHQHLRAHGHAADPQRLSIPGLRSGQVTLDRGVGTTVWSLEVPALCPAAATQEGPG